MYRYKTLVYTGLFSLHIERPSYLVSADKIKKNNFRNYFSFFSSFRKITVGGFVNQLIKNSGLSTIFIWTPKNDDINSNIYIPFMLH